MIPIFEPYFTGNEKKYLISEEYEKIYATGYEIFKENKIFGMGPNMFRKKCKNLELTDKDRYQCTTHPHSTYLQILSETGIFGMIIFVIRKHQNYDNQKKHEIWHKSNSCRINS